MACWLQPFCAGNVMWSAQRGPSQLQRKAVPGDAVDAEAGLSIPLQELVEYLYCAYLVNAKHEIQSLHEAKLIFVDIILIKLLHL